MDKLNIAESNNAGIGKNAATSEKIELKGRYFFECFDSEGNLKWSDTIENLVTTVGKNEMLDEYLAGTAYTATWYIGLIGATGYTTGPAVGDTSASHGGWVEDQNYTEANRLTTVWAAASAGSKALSAALSFSINATTTIKGAFLIDVNTKGGTTGVLFSAGDFSGGDKAVANNDTLNVSYSLAL